MGTESTEKGKEIEEHLSGVKWILGITFMRIISKMILKKN